MFSVELVIQEDDKTAITATMTAMREWLDHHRFEPSRFRYTFGASGIQFRVEFAVKAEAVAFATDFRGRVIGAAADTSSPAAEYQTAD